MGITVSINCKCGLSKDELYLMGGHFGCGNVYNLPAYCKDCKEIK